MPFNAPDTFNIPKRKPTVEYFTPVPESVFYSELVDNTDPAYQENAPMLRGRLYSTIKGGDSRIAAANPNLFFLRERRFGNSDTLVTWEWATDEAAADTFNAEVTYSAEAIAAPIYARIYRVRRDTYDASTTIATGQPLKTILAVKVTAAGSGYTDDAVALIANGATASPVLNAAGGFASIVLTAQGSDVTSAPAVILASQFTASGAGIEGVNQPYTAVSILNGKPLYQGATDSSIYALYDTAEWVIQKFVITPTVSTFGAPDAAYYLTAPTAADVPFTETWLLDSSDGQVPVPAFFGYGTGATATAIIQPQDAVLVSQKKLEYEEGSPFRNEFVRVIRVYETLPGPWLPFTRRDKNLGPVTGQRRAVLADPATQKNTLSATTSNNYEARDDSSVVSIQTQESWTDGTGSAGNPAFPPDDGPDFYDNERGSVKTTSQLVIITNPTQAGTLTSSAGTITQVRYDPFDDFHFKKVTETWAVTGPALTGSTQNSRGVSGALSRQLVAPGTSPDTGADVLQSSVNAESIAQSKKETATGALYTNSSGLIRGPFGIAGTSSEGVVAASSAAISSGINIESSVSEPEDAIRNRQKTVEFPFDTTTINSQEHADRGYIPAIAKTFVAPNSTPPAESHLIHVRRRMDTRDRTEQDVMTFANGRALITREFGECGDIDVSTDSYVAASTVPVNSGTTIERVIQEREKEARLISLVIGTGSIVTDIEKVDSRVPGSRATDEHYLVTAASSMPADTTLIEYSRFRFPKNPLLRAERKRTYAIPPDFTEVDNLGYHFATLFESFYSDDLQGATLFQRGGFSAIVPHRIVHHFYVPSTPTTPTAPVVYNIVEDELLVFSIRVSGLTDGVTFHRTTNGVTYTQTRSATSPSKSTYVGLEGTEIIARGSSNVWHAGIHEQITAYVTLQ